MLLNVREQAEAPRRSGTLGENFMQWHDLEDVSHLAYSGADV
jgi:hypothetical protein